MSSGFSSLSFNCADCADVDFCGSSAGVATDFRSNARRGGPGPLSFLFFSVADHVKII